MQKISFTTLSTPGLDVPAVARLARRFGYDGVDLRVSARSGEILPDSKNSEINAIRDVLSSEGVEAAGLLCYLSFVDLPPRQLTDSLREQMERQMEIADMLGAQSIRIGGARSDTRCYAGELGSALQVVLDKTSGIDIVIQNHTNDFTAVECLTLAKELDHPRFTLAFSPDHCVIMNEDFNAVFPELKGRARKLFIADIKPEGGMYETVLPGLGIVLLRESYEAVGGQDFDGWITFKYEKFWDPKLEGPEVSLPYFIDRAPMWYDGWKKLQKRAH